MRCVDVGCGGGAVTFEIAQRVGPAGFAIGLDMDAVKLDLARHAAATRGLANLEFREALVQEWDEGAGYDFVYSRLLLQHLTHPVDLLRRMWSAVRPGGVLAVEDADFDGCACDPPNLGFEFYVRAYCELLRRRGGDPTYGRRLLRGFREAGVPNGELRVVSGDLSLDETRWIPYSTLEAISEGIVSEGLATRSEVQTATESLANFTEEATSYLLGPTIYQVFARK